MLYLDYAKPVGGGGYILNFFADDVKDIEEVSNGKKFVTKTGVDYGAPLASSTIIITTPDKERRTFVLGEDGEWKEGGSGTSVQADYVQNDSAQPDYIKNRPFYTDVESNNDFVIVSGELSPNTSMDIRYNGTEYSDDVQVIDLDDDDGDNTEEHHLAYYIGNGYIFGKPERDFPFTYATASLLSPNLEGNALFFDEVTVNMGEEIFYNKRGYIVKNYSDGKDLIYAGNLQLLIPEADDTGENFVIFLNWSDYYEVPFKKSVILNKKAEDIDIGTLHTKKIDVTYMPDSIINNLSQLSNSVKDLYTYVPVYENGSLIIKTASGEYKKIDVSVKNLNDKTWEEIAAISAEIAKFTETGDALYEKVGKTYGINVGDTKTFTIDSGNQAGAYTLQIWDFNDKVDKDDNKIGITFGLVELLKNKIYPENSVKYIYDMLPTDLAAVIKESKLEYFDDVTNKDTQYDKVYLPSVYEVFGVTDIDEVMIPREGNYLNYWRKHYTNADRIKYISGSPDSWWLRTYVIPTRYAVGATGELDNTPMNEARGGCICLSV